MSNNQPQNPLVEYLRANKDNFPLEVLRKKLIEAGYTTEQVAEASQIVYGSEAAPPPPPPPSPSSSPPPPPAYKPEEPIAAPPAPSYQPGQPSPPIAPRGDGGFEWETILGGNWLVRIGIAALVFGTAFFFQWAIKNDLIGLEGQLALGLVGGTILIAIGDYFRTKYKVYSQLLVGGGFAILYLTVFAAFYIYDVIPAPVAFAAMIFISAIAAALAVREDAPAIATIGLLGAYFTPLMFLYDIFAKEGSPDFLTQRVIPWYLLILNLGVLAVCSIKNWRQLILIGLAGTYVMYGIWFAAFNQVTDLWLQEFYLLLYFLIFAAATILYNLVWKQKTISTDVLLILGNAITFFVWSYALLWQDYKDWLGLLPAMFAAIYISLGYLSLAWRREDLLLPLSLGSIGITSLVLIAPIQWDYPWVTIAWAAEAAILIWIGFYLALKEMRYAGMLVLLVAALRLFIVDMGGSRSPLFGNSPLLFFNERFLVFLSVIAATLLAAYFYAKWRSQVSPEEKGIFPVLLLGGNFLALFALTNDLWTYFSDKTSVFYAEINQLYRNAGVYDPPYERINQIQSDIGSIKNVRNFSVSFLWMLYAILVLAIGVAKKYRPLRIFGLVLLWLVILKVFLYDTFIIGGGWRVAAFISLGVILLATGYIYNRYSQRIKEFLLE